MNNFIIDTPDNFWQIRWLDKYMEGHKDSLPEDVLKISFPEKK